MTKKEKTLPEEAIPVQEIETPSVYSFKRFMKSFLIVTLSVACVAAGILIYQLHHKLDRYRPMLPEQKTIVSLPRDRVVKTAKAPEVQTSPLFKENTGDKKADISVVNQEIDTSAPTDNVPVQPNPVTETHTLPLLSLTEALTLRDHLEKGVACRSDLNHLLKSRSSDEKWGDLVEKLTAVCASDTSSQSEMKSLFYKNKKKALTAYYLETNPLWLAYPKVLLSNIIEIRKIKPETETPLDIVSVAQNNLMQGRIETAVETIDKLPRYMKPAFEPFLTKATDYIAAMGMIEHLILSFDTKGDF